MAPRFGATPQNHAHRGAAWEAVLDLLHAGYLARGEAVVLRTPAPFKPVRREGALLVGYHLPGPHDYLAVLPGGQAVALEAKSTVEARWPFKDLPVHQAEALDAVERVGGLGAVLLHLGACPSRPGRPARWVLPWARLGPLWRTWHQQASQGRQAAPGTASLGAVEADTLGRRFDGWGWLGPLLVLREQATGGAR